MLNKKKLTLALGSVMLLSLLTILISSPVQAIGSQLDPNDNNFTISDEVVVIVTTESHDSTLKLRDRIPYTTEYIYDNITPEEFTKDIKSLSTEPDRHVLSVAVHDAEGRLGGNHPTIAVRVGLIHSQCDTSTLSNPDSSCWIYSGPTGETNGYNLDNLLSTGNSKCECTQETGGKCYNMTCYTNTILTKTDFGTKDFNITASISQQKYCGGTTSLCHNNGDPFTEDGKVEDCVNKLCKLCTPKKGSAPSTSYTCHNTTHRNLTKTFTYDVSCQGVSNTYTSDNPISCGVGKVCSSSNTCVTPNSDCTTNGACDEEETCSNDNHCAGTLECESDSNKCRESDDCRQDNSCVSDEICDLTPDCNGDLKCTSDNQCSTHTNSNCKSTNTCGEGRACVVGDKDCEAGYTCDSDSNKCVKLGDCKLDNNCRAYHYCYATNDCAGSLQCRSQSGGATSTCQSERRSCTCNPTLECTSSTNLKSSGSCCSTINTNCAATGRICENGACVNPPVTSITCSGNTATITDSNGNTDTDNCNSNQYCKAGVGNGCLNKKNNG